MRAIVSLGGLAVLGAIGVFFRMNPAGDRDSNSGSNSPPPAETGDRLAFAENLHAEYGAMERDRDPERAEDMRRRALGGYELAFRDTDPVRFARAYIGAGQMKLAGGDTPGAIELWMRAVDETTDSFQALRAMKSIADAAFDEGAADGAGFWYRRIIDENSDGEMTQQTRIIVEASRKRIDQLSGALLKVRTAQ